MFLKANSDTEICIKRFKMSPEKILNSGNCKRHFWKGTKIRQAKGAIGDEKKNIYIQFFNSKRPTCLKNQKEKMDFLAVGGNETHPLSGNFR